MYAMTITPHASTSINTHQTQHLNQMLTPRKTKGNVRIIWQKTLSNILLNCILFLFRNPEYNIKKYHLHEQEHCRSKLNCHWFSILSLCVYLVPIIDHNIFRLLRIIDPTILGLQFNFVITKSNFKKFEIVSFVYKL